MSPARPTTGRQERKPLLPRKGIFRNPEPPRRTVEEPSTETARNERLHKQRYSIWRAAEAATRYWRARFDFESPLAWAQDMEISEGRYHPVVDRKDRYAMVDKWREATAKQLLTPAPDARALTWKRQVLAGRHFYRHETRAGRTRNR